MRARWPCNRGHIEMLKRIAGAIALSSAIIGSATVAQESEYFLVWISTEPEVTRTGAFMSVCIDSVEGIAILRELASDIRWGSGSNQTPNSAASMFPFFSTPALVTADCLEETLSEYQVMYGRDDLAVRELN